IVDDVQDQLQLFVNRVHIGNTGNVFSRSVPVRDQVRIDGVRDRGKNNGGVLNSGCCSDSHGGGDWYDRIEVLITSEATHNVVHCGLVCLGILFLNFKVELGLI